MSRIIKSFNAEVVKRTAKRCKARGIVIPTFAQMRHPETAPEAIKARLKTVGLWDVDPANLFRITWKNDPAERACSAAPTTWRSPRPSPASRPASSAWWANTSPPARTRWGRPSPAWCRAW